MNVIERNNVKIRGRGRTAMVFAHGYGCNQNMWRLMTPAFEDAYRIILFDHVGAGGSDVSAYNRTKYGTLNGYAQDLLEVLKTLDLSETVFVGHSVSAMIGLLAAIERPSAFSKLVLIGPSPCYIDAPDYSGGFTRESIEGLLNSLETDHPAWSRAMAPVIMGNLERPELGTELVESFCQTKPEIAKHFARVTFLSDNRADLPKLKTPALILQCSNDAIAPEVVGRYLEKTLQMSELKLLRATGHCPHLSAPEETIAAIKAYLSKP